MVEKESGYTRPNRLEVGRSLVKMFECFDVKGALVGDGVGGFFGSRNFEIPINQTIDLVYLTPRDLGFEKPVSLIEIKKVIEKKKMALGECPMDTAMNLADMMPDPGDAGPYYVVSKKQRDKSVREDTPDFLKIGNNDQGQFGIFGWMETEPIPTDGFLVFKDVSCRLNLTEL